MRKQLSKRTQLGTLTAMLAAAAAGITIIVAPVASAAPPLLPGCEVVNDDGDMQGGMTTDCASPGNAQIYSTPPVYMPMYPWDSGFGMMW